MLFQLCYASTTTSEKSNLPIDLREILNEAHYFNRVNHIQGVLYFANGYFFQCLEGDQDTILKLIEKIRHDPRHHNLQVLSQAWVEQTSFNAWLMKFVRKNSEVSAFFKTLEQSDFNPYLLTPTHIAEFIPLLANVKMEEVE